jgi:hypothetical protein
MAEDFWSKDMLDLMQKMWNPMGFPLPGMIAPTVSVEEIDRKVTELRSVENWLKMNLSFLQMTIKTLELQRSALDALRDKPDPPSPRGRAK